MKRLAAYRFADPDGIVEDLVLHSLRGLASVADRVVVVADQPLSNSGRARLAEVADAVVLLPEADSSVMPTVRALDSDDVRAHDEVILADARFVGPVFPFVEAFTAMADQEVDFWGLTSRRAPVEPADEAGADGDTVLHPHLLVVRRRLLASPAWEAYWSTDAQAARSGLVPESFTRTFSGAGFTWRAAWPVEDFPTGDPLLESAHHLLRARCPVLAFDLFAAPSSRLEHGAVLGRRVLAELEQTDFPLSALWRALARAAEPRHVYTNLSLLEVIGDQVPVGAPSPGLRIGVLAHIYYDDLVDEMMARIGTIPVPYALHVTTDTEAKRTSILTQLADHDIAEVDVRVVDSNQGRDTSALLIGQRDLLSSNRFDLICRVHSKKSPQDAVNIGGLFRDHLYDNLLHSPGHVAEILRLFDQHPTLGMVFPPVINIGYPTMGHAWFANRAPAEALAKRLGIATKFDKNTPLAAYGSMFWARPETLRKLVEADWQWTDFPEDGEYRDGSLTHVLERLLAYAVLDAGFHVRSVINQEWASVNYPFLEYKLEQVSAYLPGQTEEQLRYLESLRGTSHTAPAGALSQVSRRLEARFPALEAGVRRGLTRAGAIKRRMRSRTDS